MSVACLPIAPLGRVQKSEKWTHRELHPDPRFAGPMSSYWTMSPCCSAAGVGIEPTPPGSEPGIATSSDYPAMCSLTKNAMRESNPPVQLGRLTPLPIGQWHMCVAAALFHTSNFTLQTSSKHPAGLEPALPPWRDGTLPLRDGCVCFLTEKSRSRWSRTTAVAISERSAAVTPPSVMPQIGKVGFEPNLASLKGWQPHQKSNGPCCARTPRAMWAGRRSNPPLLVFSQALHHLS